MKVTQTMTQFIRNPTAAALVAALALAGCQGADLENNPKQTLGTVIGAGLGALAGSQFGGGKGQMAAVALGALAGAWAGSELGKSLDAADRGYMNRNAQDSLEYNRAGATSSWKNPDSGNSGQFRPTKTYKTSRGEHCRDYEQTIYVDGREETALGRACRRDDGTWEIVS